MCHFPTFGEASSICSSICWDFLKQESDSKKKEEKRGFLAT
jgi:hypothetical protein